MRFRLHTALLTLALGPPVLAGLWLLLSNPWPVPLTELIVLGVIAFALSGSAALGAAADSS